MIRLTRELCQGRAITTDAIRERYSVSHATAKRDLVNLEIALGADAVVFRLDDGAKCLRIDPRP
jgi:hypothetical protein